ncbi:acyltransferase family protein [Dysgonomonas sp. Marseille-P4361]|uniref:acyltransferase family protein n=1 Tax=Dysgonomonas sp. Marseille-P4361 TaxID=2161820 RepID=UPI000D5546A7|nr:acyltransferase family protein [Dysgonomonas sp. Marseille-P4361]
MTQDNTTRVEWVDLAKGITILLVVLGHVLRGLDSANLINDQATWNIDIDRIIYSFHMHLFMILSGLFFVKSIHKYEPIGLLKNKTKTVLYPYIVWSILHTAIEVVLSNFTNGNIQPDTLLTCVFIPRAHFWFLFALFFINLINIIFYTLFRSHWLILSSVMGGICYFLSLDLSIFTATFKFLLFFNIGIIVSTTIFDTKTVTILSKKKYLILSLLMFIIIQSLNLSSSLTYYTVFKFIIAIISSLFCIIGSLVLSSYMRNIFARGIKLLGENTMYIYIMHILITAGIRIFLIRIDVTNVYIHVILGTIIGIVIPCLIAIKFRKNKYFDILFRLP